MRTSGIILLFAAGALPAGPAFAEKAGGRVISTAVEKLQSGEDGTVVPVKNAVSDLETARKFLKLGKHTLAVEAARLAVEQDPDSAEPYAIMAESLYAINDYGAAYEAADASLARDPQNKRARDILQLAKARLPGLASAKTGGGSSSPEDTEEAAAVALLAFLGVGAMLAGAIVIAALLRPRGSGGATTRKTGPVTPGDAALERSYRIVQRIGSGGMGHVYEAVDLNLNRRVAIKQIRDEIRDDPKERERFLQEARLVAALKHPNIVGIHTLVVHDPDVYLVFEYVDGHTVGEHLTRWRRLNFGQALWVLKGVCTALEYAHFRGIVHRDLKPANVMITRDHVVKVMDFGVARLARDTLRTKVTLQTIVGTPPYMAPEQEEGVSTKQSDIYALAVCFYEMITGELPFTGSAGVMLLAKTQKTYVSPSRRVGGLPEGVDEVLDRALEPDPAKRCRTPTELARGLELLLPTGERQDQTL